jgi:hypothetical protein
MSLIKILMMQAKWGYFFLVVLALASCKKENDRVFDQSPDVRINATLNKYQTQLETAENGWKAVVVTDEGRGASFGFYFKFSNTNRVTMYSDFNNTSASTSKESSYRLKALQQVSLLFDTYSYIHVLADPDPEVAGGALGSGYGVDFEFYFDNATNDTINLVGRKHGNKARLVRATKAEADAYNAGSMKDALPFDNNYSRILQYWKTFTVNGVTYQVAFNASTRRVTISWKDSDGTSHSFSTGYYFTGAGLEFVDPITNGTTFISGFTNITWNGTNRNFGIRVNGVTSTLAGAAAPAYVDLNAAKDFRSIAITADSYWFDDNEGIRVNGVDNAYRTDTLTYNDAVGTWTNLYLLYQPAGVSTTIDAFAPVFLNPSQRGVELKYALLPRFVNNVVDGRFILSASTAVPNIEPPTTGGFAQVQAWLYNTRGHYLVKIDDKTYDMVNANDATSWIRWYLWE